MGIRVGEAINPGPSRRPVRPIHGRDVAPRTASEHGTMLDSDSNAPLARVGPRLGTRHEDCPQSRVLPRATLLDSDSDAPLMSTAVCGQLLDALEEDLMQPVIPQKKRVRRVSDSPSPTRGSGRFQAMTESCVESQNRECGASHGDEGIEATHFDLTVADSGDEVVERDTPQDVGQQAERSHQYSESDTESVRQIRRRRLVLQFEPDPAPCQGEEREDPREVDDETSDCTGVPLTSSVMVGLGSLDEVNLESVFEISGIVMKTVPKFMRGVFRGAIKTSLQAILRGHERKDVELPRLLLARPPRGGLVPQGRLKERVARFSAGEWVPLLEMSLECSMQGNVASRRRRRRATDDLQCGVGRVLGLAQMGELSHARRALEGEPVAWSSENTWKALTNEAKIPRTAREGIDQELLDMNPTVPVDLDVDLLLKNLRTSRRGAAAGGLSGMTTEHLKIILDSTECCALFGDVATLFARGQIPREILEGVRVGRMTALQKPDGGVRGIVVGDVVAGWWPEHWHNNLVFRLKAQPTRSSTHCPREQAQNAWHMWCRH